MADNTSVTSPYPYLRRVSSLPEIMSAASINLADTIILVQTNTTKRTTIDTLITKILDLIDAPDAFELAKRHGFIDPNSTIEEWFEWLRGGGVSHDELKLVVGKYQIVKGVMGVDANNQLEFVRDESENSTIHDDAFIIYQDKTTLKCYTKQPESNAYYEWDGMLDAFTFISEVVGNKENTPTYQAHMRTTDSFPKRVVNGTEVDDPYQVTTFAGLRVYENRDPKLGELIRLSYTDDPYGHMVFYDGTKFVDYTGVIDYIQIVTNNVFRITAGAAVKLADPREITIATGLDEDNLTDITAAIFDGSADATITINKINADVIAGSGDFTAARSITAEKIKDPIDINLTGAVNETIENVDMSRDITVNISSINAQYITGALDPNNATAGKLTTARDIGIASSIVGDTLTNITAASFDGTEDVEITVNAINGGLISGAVANAASAQLANRATLADDATHAVSADTATTAVAAETASKANKLTNAFNIGITSGLTDDTLTNATAAAFDGTNNVDVQINAINAGLLTGNVPETVFINGASNKVRVVNQTNVMYLLGSPVGSNDGTTISDSSDVVVQRSVRKSGSAGVVNATIDSSGNLTVGSMKSNRSVSSSSDGFYGRNIGYGTTESPSSSYTSNNGDIWVYY